MDIFEIRAKTGYDKRTRHGTPEPHCFLCGRRVKDDEYMVGMNFNGTLTMEDNAEQGWFPVGPNCWRRYIHASDIDTDYWMAKAGGEPTTYIPGSGWVNL